MTVGIVESITSPSATVTNAAATAAVSFAWDAGAINVWLGVLATLAGIAVFALQGILLLMKIRVELRAEKLNNLRHSDGPATLNKN